jgi:hypothetical protein
MEMGFSFIWVIPIPNTPKSLSEPFEFKTTRRVKNSTQIVQDCLCVNTEGPASWEVTNVQANGDGCLRLLLFRGTSWLLCLKLLSLPM